MSNYCTIAEVKAVLGIGDTTYDTILTRLVDTVSRAIEDKTGRVFYPSDTETRNYLPESSGYCIIDDCNTFTSLVAQNSTWTLGQDFYLQPINAAFQGIPFTSIRTIARPFLFTKADVPTTWSVLDGRVQVTGSFGWAATPGPIHDAAILMAERMFKRQREAPTGFFSTGVDSPVVRVRAFDPDVAELLSPYTITFIA